MKIQLSALLGISALAFLLAATPVFAAEVDVTGENNTTGPNSSNDNDYDVDQDIDVDVDNHAHVKNGADVDVNSGDNEQEHNTTAGDIDTGDVDATTDWESVVNGGASLVGASDADLEVIADFVNDTTGPHSSNDNDLDVDQDIDVDLDNMAYIRNYLDFVANTGDNEQKHNTTAGDINTGDASLLSLISNWANNGSGYAGATHGGLSVDVTGQNNTTGPNSSNDNDYDVDQDIDVDVDNHAHVKNKVDVALNTGGNEQKHNTTAGDINTGDADATVDILNSVNNGGGMSGASDSDLEVIADFVNDTTGPSSSNDNDLDVDQDVDVDVDNDADVKNYVDVDANTGDNEQHGNTEAGSTDTGDVTIDIVVTNEVNN